tara:strand:+ start:460 stop:1044 length:585 start_codon:yes stop_codon:yes gene_type:complete
MAKVPYPDIASLEPRVQMMVAVAAPLNLIKVMAHAQGNVESVLRLSDAVLNRGVLNPVLRQVALIRLCVVMGSDYERTLLESVSVGEGMSQSLIEAAREGSASAKLDEMQRAAARLAEELNQSVRPSSETYDYLAARLSVRELIELVQAIGFYLMQARVIETFGVELEQPPVDLARRMENADTEGLQAWRNGTR